MNKKFLKIAIPDNMVQVIYLNCVEICIFQYYKNYVKRYWLYEICTAKDYKTTSVTMKS